MTLNLIESQAPPDLIHRNELVSLAQREGLVLTSRTVRYWASMGWIPQPWRVEGQGFRAFYPKSLLKRLRVLAALRPKRLQELKENLSEVETVQFGEETFDVLPAVARWERENTRCSLRMLADGSGMLLIQKKGAPEGSHDVR